MQENRADDRRNERIAAGLVRESAQSIQPLGTLIGGRGYVQDAVVAVVNHPDVLFQASQPTRGGGIVQGILGQDTVQIEDYSGVKGLRARLEIERMAWKFSLLSRGRRPWRSISLATCRVVDAPSSWLEVIASSTSERTK